MLTNIGMEIDMTANSLQGSAKIYQFPAGGRAGLSGPRHGTKPAADLAARMPKVTSGGAWYHEQAIRDAENVRKN
jgi:Protein of unknown function (DUF2735)